jgi:hypothetical protein
MAALSYQGISDRVAADYMDRHGQAKWSDIEVKVAACPTCPKLECYWHFYGCWYNKISRTCSEPDHIGQCPVPDHDLRNGRLNQTAYSLYLFVRDIADGLNLGIGTSSCDAPSVSRTEQTRRDVRHQFSIRSQADTDVRCGAFQRNEN